MKKKSIIVIAAILVIAVLGFMFIKGQNKTKIPHVKTVSVEKGDIETFLSTNALIQSKKTKNYMGLAQYTVEKVFVKVGQKVKNADLLLTYDVSELDDAVKQAQIQLDNSILNKQELLKQKSDIEKEIIDLDEQIFKLDGSNNPQDIANVQQMIQKRKSLQTISEEKVKLMDNSIEMSELSLKAAQNKLNKASEGIKADFDGVITSVNAEEGITLSMGKPAFVLQQLDSLKGKIKLSKYDASKIRLGQKASIKNGNNLYQGEVSFIDPAAKKDDAMSNKTTLEAEIDILNADENLKVDFDVDVDILVSQAKQVLTLPIECVQFKDKNTSVFVVNNGTAKLVPVIVGIQSDTMIEIMEGLSEGDIVISNPTIEIADGTVVSSEGVKK